MSGFYLTGNSYGSISCISCKVILCATGLGAGWVASTRGVPTRLIGMSLPCKLKSKNKQSLAIKDYLKLINLVHLQIIESSFI